MGVFSASSLDNTSILVLATLMSAAKVTNSASHFS